MPVSDHTAKQNKKNNMTPLCPKACSFHSPRPQSKVKTEKHPQPHEAAPPMLSSPGSFWSSHRGSWLFLRRPWHRPSPGPSSSVPFTREFLRWFLTPLPKCHFLNDAIHPLKNIYSPSNMHRSAPILLILLYVSPSNNFLVYCAHCLSSVSIFHDHLPTLLRQRSWPTF